MVREPDATMQPTPQDNQLLSKHRVLSFKPQLRPEWRGQDGQSETEQPDHFASLGDSITSSTRIRFSVHTGPRQIAVRAVYKIPPRTSSAPSPIRNILASQFIAATHNRTGIQDSALRFVPELTGRLSTAVAWVVSARTTER
jgi:hypothetical protein